jgi:hypothetical protein
MVIRLLWVGLARELLMMAQEGDGVAKREVTHGHHQFNGVEVGLAVETARQVLARMQAGVKSGTPRAAKTQDAIALLGWHREFSEH